MCEFTVLLKGEQVMRDVVYAEVREGGVLLRTVLGEERFLEGCRILQVDVEKELLKLEASRA
jgi:predicted RNA-binding protein